MKRQNCINCVFSSWYHNFRNITLRSKIIHLPVEFISYLLSDGIVLPDADHVKYANDVEGYSDEDYDGWDSTEGSTINNTSTFPELKKQVEDAIENLGGIAFPKLNWSSPKDAAWISHNGTLKCSSFNEVCLLLKSSDFVMNDLTNAYKFCEDSQPHQNDQFELVLRKYENIVPGMEFRCFVKENRLIGITQRHITTHFGYLVNNKTKISDGIVNFFNSKIKSKFCDTTYVFDVYNTTYDIIKLIDFNPFGKITDSMLFAWEELNEIDPMNVDYTHEDFFRIVTESNNIQPSPFMQYALPRDIVDLSCGEDVNKMLDFLKVRDLISKPSEEDDLVSGDD